MAVEWEQFSGHLCPVHPWGFPVPTHALQCNQQAVQQWKFHHLTQSGSPVGALALASFAFESRRRPLLTM